jgi:hypothetical protein
MYHNGRDISVLEDFSQNDEESSNFELGKSIMMFFRCS